MPEQEKRNVIIGIVVVALAIIFALWWMLARVFGWWSPSVKPVSGIVTGVPVTELPQGFASSTPFFSVLQTDESFNVDNGATMEAGRKYISSMPAFQVFNLYKQFYSQTGWTLSDFIVGNIAKTPASFTGTKGSESVAVKVALDPTNVTSTDVYITYTFPK